MSDSRAGLCSATINGTNVDVVELKADVAAFKQEIMIGQSGLQGNKKTHKAGKITIKVRDSADLSVGQFDGMNGATVVGVTASGKSYSGSNLTQTAENLEVDTMEGTFELVFEGDVQEGTGAVS